MQANCDFGHAVSQMHAPLFQMCYDVLRKLKKDHPEYVVPIISMLFPTITPMGTSLFAKAGLGNPALAKCTEDMLTTASSG